MTELITERLELLPWRSSDVDAYAAIVADPKVMRFLGGPIDRDMAWRQLALYIGHRSLRGWSTSAVIERATGRLIGRGCHQRGEGWPGLEVGWALKPGSWGQGYASELGRAVRDYAFDDLGADHLLSINEQDNGASVRVAEAIGAHFERFITMFGMRMSPRQTALSGASR